MDQQLNKLLEQYKKYQTMHLNIDMTRGKPCKAQLDLSLEMNDVLNSKSDYLDENGNDVRNYGSLEGIPECRRLMASILGVNKEHVLVFGNSSLSIMYEQIARSYIYGINGSTPWSKLDKVKWLCPVPGYDRHFAMLEHFGIEMINIPLNIDGPDMDLVESIIKDDSVKGIWCVPKHSNPSGITYSDEVIKRLARLSPKAKDFRIYYDNAYALHDFSTNSKSLLNIYEEAKKVGNEDIIYLFASTSKISFPGSGIAALGASQKNIEDIKSHLKYQTISYDKVNQLRHVRYFKDLEGIKNHVKKHAKIIKEKFDIVDSALTGVKDLVKYVIPEGGYFFCLEVKNKASQIIARCKECGVKLTEAGSTHPYHKDPTNSYIRLAPTYLENDELKIAMKVITLSIKIESLL